MNDQTDEDRFADLPPETKKFLKSLREEDVDTLSHGITLVRAVSTVGTFMKWLIVGLFGIIVGFVMLWENVLKLLHLTAQNK